MTKVRKISLKAQVFVCIALAISSLSTHAFQRDNLRCVNEATGAQIDVLGPFQTEFFMNQQLIDNVSAQLGFRFLGRYGGTVNQWTDLSRFYFRSYPGDMTVKGFENGSMEISIQISNLEPVFQVGRAHFYFNPGECQFHRPF